MTHSGTMLLTSGAASAAAGSACRSPGSSAAAAAADKSCLLLLLVVVMPSWAAALSPAQHTHACKHTPASMQKTLSVKRRLHQRVQRRERQDLHARCCCRRVGGYSSKMPAASIQSTLRPCCQNGSLPDALPLLFMLVLLRWAACGLAQ